MGFNDSVAIRERDTHDYSHTSNDCTGSLEPWNRDQVCNSSSECAYVRRITSIDTSHHINSPFCTDSMLQVKAKQHQAIRMEKCFLDETTKHDQVLPEKQHQQLQGHVYTLEFEKMHQLTQNYQPKQETN